jgi:hypothetical protein
MHMMRVRILLIVRGKIRHESDRGLDIRRETLSEHQDDAIETLLPSYLNFEASEALAVSLIVHHCSNCSDIATRLFKFRTK